MHSLLPSPSPPVASPFSVVAPSCHPLSRLFPCAATVAVGDERDGGREWRDRQQRHRQRHRKQRHCQKQHRQQRQRQQRPPVTALAALRRTPPSPVAFLSATVAVKGKVDIAGTTEGGAGVWRKEVGEGVRFQGAAKLGGEVEGGWLIGGGDLGVSKRDSLRLAPPPPLLIPLSPPPL
ncbi:unnamed protein product [Closterium sp. NIES-64]|nr:unnamed protein product [Closterium sp. NIES-64]